MEMVGAVAVPGRCRARPRSDRSGWVACSGGVGDAARLRALPEPRLRRARPERHGDGAASGHAGDRDLGGRYATTCFTVLPGQAALPSPGLRAAAAGRRVRWRRRSGVRPHDAGTNRVLVASYAVFVGYFIAEVGSAGRERMSTREAARGRSGSTGPASGSSTCGFATSVSRSRGPGSRRASTTLYRELEQREHRAPAALLALGRVVLAAQRARHRDPVLSRAPAPHPPGAEHGARGGRRRPRGVHAHPAPRGGTRGAAWLSASPPAGLPADVRQVVDASTRPRIARSRRADSFVQHLRALLRAGASRRGFRRDLRRLDAAAGAVAEAVRGVGGAAQARVRRRADGGARRDEAARADARARRADLTAHVDAARVLRGEARLLRRRLPEHVRSRALPRLLERRRSTRIASSRRGSSRATRRRFGRSSHAGRASPSSRSISCCTT